MIADTPPAFECKAPVKTLDGDTFRCKGVTWRVRIAGIDTPELPGHCRKGRACAPGDPYAAKLSLAGKLRGHIMVYPKGWDRYQRIIARVTVNGIDIGEQMVREGHAVRWPR